MNKDIIEAIGKLGIGIVSVCGLIWILHGVITENEGLVNTLTQQVELAERQTEALEKLVEIYSGDEK